MPTLTLVHLNNTPVFMIPGVNPVYDRVHASIFDKKNARWLFPAYAPFGLLVISDLRKVDPSLQYSPDVEKHVTHLERIPQLVKDRVLPDGFKFYGPKPFDHQLEGLVLLLNYPRFALWWPPGM